MDKEKLYTLINDSDASDAALLPELKALADEYPYFHTARLLYTKNLHAAESPQYEEELGKTAVFCGDRRKLFYLITENDYRAFLRKPDDARQHQTDRTQALLDSFLTSLEETETDEMAVNPQLNIVSTDYLAYLESLGADTETEKTEAQPMKHQDIIDTFIEKAASDEIFTSSPISEPNSTHNANNEEDGDMFLTETLARIYIKQKKYEQALTIIKRLSLNFPKKSVYFADQIRFLEYLILNEKNKNN